MFWKSSEQRRVVGSLNPSSAICRKMDIQDNGVLSWRFLLARMYMYWWQSKYQTLHISRENLLVGVIDEVGKVISKKKNTVKAFLKFLLVKLVQNQVVLKASWFEPNRIIYVIKKLSSNKAKHIFMSPCKWNVSGYQNGYLSNTANYSSAHNNSKWKQPEYLPGDKCTNVFWHIHTVDCIVAEIERMM